MSGDEKWLLGILIPVATAVAIAGSIVVSRQGRGGGEAFALSGQPERTVELYSFVAANPEIAAMILCYCGCGNGLGHQHLLDCFISPKNGEYESHASFCSICTDEAEDVRELMAEGRSSAQIRAWIDAEYGRFGAPTDTP